MKKITHTLLSACALFAATLFVHADDTAPKIAVVDMEKIFNQHYATVAENAKIKSEEGKAQQQVDQMMKDRNDLVDQFKALQDQVNNPTITADAKAKATSDAQHKYGEVQQKQQDIQKFVTDARNTLGQQAGVFRNQLLDDISKTATRIAKEHGANLLFDKGAHSSEGIQTLLYADDSFDITNEVIAEINKNKPADLPAAPSASDTAAPSLSAPSSDLSPSSSSPSITVPNVTPGK